MSKALRDRRNRKDTSEKYQEYLTGSLVSVTCYCGETRMVEVMTPVPSTAVFAGRVHDDILPGKGATQE